MRIRSLFLFLFLITIPAYGQVKMNHIFTDPRPLLPIPTGKPLRTGEIQCGDYFRKQVLANGEAEITYASIIQPTNSECPIITKEPRNASQVTVILDESVKPISPTVQITYNELIFNGDPSVKKVVLRLPWTIYKSAEACLPTPEKVLNKKEITN